MTCSAASPSPAPALLVATLDGIADGTLRAQPAARRRGLARAEGDRRRRPGRLGGARRAAVDRRVRAVTPRPGRGRRSAASGWGSARCAPLDPGRPRSSSRASCTSRSARVLVGTATAPSCWARCGPAGKRTMPAAGLGARRADRGRGRCCGESSRIAADAGRATEHRRHEVRPCGSRGGARPAPAGRAARAAGQGPPRPPELDPARLAALDLLTAVRVRNAYANLALPASCAAHGLADRDAALATELGYGTLRAQGTARRGARGVHRPPAAPGRAAGARRAAAGRLPAAAHPGAAARRGRHHRRAGPGRRRRRARPGSSTPCCAGSASTARPPGWTRLAPDLKEDPVGHAAFAHAHPRWIVAGVRATRWATADPTRRARRGAAADDARPDRAPARPARRDTAEELALVTGGEPAPVLALRRAPGARRRRRRRPGRRRARGWPCVQDEGSQLVALALTRAPLDGPRRARWLDLCAGPGGKSALLGGLVALRGRRRWTPWSRAEHRAELVAPGRRRAAGDRARRGRPRRRRCPTARSTACWSTPRAPAWARCAAVRRRAGGGAPTTSPGWPGCSGSCSARGAAARPPGRRGRLRHLLAAPGRDRRRGRRRDRRAAQAAGTADRASSGSTPAPCLPGVPELGDGPDRAAVAAPARHGRDVPGAAAPHALTWRCRGANPRGVAPDDRSEHPVGRLRPSGRRGAAVAGRPARAPTGCTSTSWTTTSCRT